MYGTEVQSQGRRHGSLHCFSLSPERQPAPACPHRELGCSSTHSVVQKENNVLLGEQGGTSPELSELPEFPWPTRVTCPFLNQSPT